ncbi:MAG TPA: hypothetical protein DCL61_19945 [Cyanobacteria bacterium UBA12227]|nr:hypothetical protein [Cyanobacteria bacterium UBA12227]HAX88745.1 hypothetical protein [Cyanobacteria bacterium UBA11370]HBY76065.1 hypothetical protein [Cyanobacteria bacterium UBA11148]
MECSLKSRQPTINVCSKIKCPFFNARGSRLKGCARYCNSEACHLTSVFAFKSDGHCLFTADEIELRHMKKINDKWIAQNNASIPQLVDGECDHFPLRLRKIRKSVPQPLDIPMYSSDPLTSTSPNSCSIQAKFAPISICLLNSIEFEDY